MWKERLLDLDLGSTVDDYSDTVEAVFDALDRGETIDLTDLGELVNWHHLACTLRCTYSFRQQVPGWNEAVSIARRAIESEGKENASEILAGLEDSLR